MKLYFETCCLLSSPQDEEMLSRIIHKIVDGWHSWNWPDPAMDELRDYFERHPLHSEIIDKSFLNANMYAGGSGKELTVANCLHERSGHVVEPRLDLSTAAAYLAQPLRLLVENMINDGQFIRRMLSVLDPDLVAWLDDPSSRFQLEHGGGKAEILKLMKNREKLHESAGYPPRLMVLVDSDAKYPGHQTAESNKIVKQAETMSLPVMILNNRAIENYVPDRILSRCAAENPDVVASVEFILQLRPEQRNYYPMKSGISSVVHKGALFVGEMSDGEVRLYAGVKFPETPAKLPRIAEYFLHGDGASDCSLADLESRGCLAEMKDFILAIRREL